MRRHYLERDREENKAEEEKPFALGCYGTQGDQLSRVGIAPAALENEQELFHFVSSFPMVHQFNTVCKINRIVTYGTFDMSPHLDFSMSEEKTSICGG